MRFTCLHWGRSGWRCSATSTSRRFSMSSLNGTARLDINPLSPALQLPAVHLLQELRSQVCWLVL